MGEARIGPVGEFQGDDDAPIRVTSMAARSTESGGVACVAGCDDGRLFLVECSRDDTVTCVEMRRDSANGKAGTPGDGGASTPSKWGMAALSATKAALSFLREPTAAADAAVTVVKSVTWAPNASNGDAARVLVLTDTIVEEWEVDCDGGGGFNFCILKTLGGQIGAGGPMGGGGTGWCRRTARRRKSRACYEPTRRDSNSCPRPPRLVRAKARS